MVNNIAQWRRVIVVDGAQRREVLLATGSSVMESLQNEGINMYSRSVLVVAADGSQIDVSATPKLADGALLTVIDLGAVAPGTSQPVGRVAPRGFNYSSLLWSAAALAALVVSLVAATGSPAAALFAEDLARYASVGVLAALAILASLSIGSASPTAGSLSPAALFVPGALGFAAGFIAIPAFLEASGQLAVFAGLLAAAIAQATVHLRHAGEVSSGATGLVTLVIALASGAWGMTLIAGFDASVAAALIVGAAPVALRVLPALCLDIPEGQLLEYSEFMRNRWTVRGPIPQPSQPVTATDMASTMSRAQWQLLTGTVVFSLVPVLALPVLLFSPAADAVARIAAVVLTATVVVSFLLSPRQANTGVTRWSPRLAAGLVALEFALFAVSAAPGVAVLVATIVVVLAAVVMAATMVPLTRGFRSLGVSRAADIFESISTALAFPAAFVAAGLIDILRGVVS